MQPHANRTPIPTEKPVPPILETIPTLKRHLPLVNSEHMCYPSLMNTRLSTLIYPERSRGGLPKGSLQHAKQNQSLPVEARRRRGGQPGNQNARKHGFFSDNLSPAEINEFWSLIRQEDIPPEEVLLRLKFQSFLLSGSINPRVIKKASSLLTRWHGNGLNRSDTQYLKSVIDCLLYDLAISANIKKTDQNESSVL